MKAESKDDYYIGKIKDLKEHLDALNKKITEYDGTVRML